MSMIPLATFLAGSLLSMLLPILLLITLVVWYLRSIRRVPGGDASKARRATAAEHAVPASAAPVEAQPPGSEPPVGTA